jgi:AhpC/TSA family
LRCHRTCDGTVEATGLGSAELEYASVEKKTRAPNRSRCGTGLLEWLDSVLKRFLTTAAATASGIVHMLMNEREISVELSVGDRAPDFSLPGSDGRTYELSAMRGASAVVLAWFPKAFTGG